MNEKAKLTPTEIAEGIFLPSSTTKAFIEKVRAQNQFFGSPEFMCLLCQEPEIQEYLQKHQLPTEKIEAQLKALCPDRSKAMQAVSPVVHKIMGEARKITQARLEQNPNSTQEITLIDLLQSALKKKVVPQLDYVWNQLH